MATDFATFTWSPLVYDLSAEPQLRQTYDIKDEANHKNFARSAKWTPDGSVFMAQCEDRTLQLFNPPQTSGPNPTRPDLVLRQPAPVLDFTWYPTASPNDPASFCFLTSVRESPVKLFDASDGRLRASYKIVDHRERFIAPHSMAFNLNASKIYCGYEDAIEVFDVARPGEGTRILTTPSRKSKDGLKGIISALAFSPDYSTGSDAFYAVGTLNPTLSNLALYSESQSNAPLMFVSGGDRAGVTQVRFNSMNPHILYAAYRRRGAILAWDLRADISSPFAKYVVPYKPTTNQKMLFDVDVAGQRLVVGDQRGSISVFDLNVTGGGGGGGDSSETVVKHPDFVFDAHSDSVGSVTFHPYQPILLSVSGSRHYEDVHQDAESEDDSDASDEVRIKSRRELQPGVKDSSIKTWDFQSVAEESS
ncbi:WD40 repeat-like protein [Macrolepiota fuliginosa MF-IS2]|uniref:WD40 repeat-like protein n=1 Tax=Macrolepiota fuliginosa MF-IS2 TaxID=1400762 RepID=A0A9P5XBR2_9AGAR|nr:WD40 repeat-like protein [Macrolepiota fuliginosa MF-IS2]